MSLFQIDEEVTVLKKDGTEVRGRIQEVQTTTRREYIIHRITVGVKETPKLTTSLGSFVEAKK